MKIRYCKDCIYKKKLPNNADVCALSKLMINLDKDFCSNFKSQLCFCNNCKTLIPNPEWAFAVQIEEDEWAIFCPNCLKMWLNS